MEKIDYRKYPEYMFAIIATYLPVSEGDDIRKCAGNVIFRHEQDGKTYKNGTLHSFDDKPTCRLNHTI